MYIIWRANTYPRARTKGKGVNLDRGSDLKAVGPEEAREYSRPTKNQSNREKGELVVQRRS